MGLSRQEYWGGLPCPPPGDLPDPGIEPASLASAALAGGFFTTVPCGKPISTPTTQGTVSQYKSPIKEIRVPWINAMTLKLWQGKYQMNVEHIVKTKWKCSFAVS